MINIKPEFRVYVDNIVNRTKEINPLVSLKLNEASISFFIGEQMFAWLLLRKTGLEIAYCIDIINDKWIQHNYESFEDVIDIDDVISSFEQAFNHCLCNLK